MFSFPTRDLTQYGNEKGVSAQHYLIKINTAIDRNSKVEAMSVILNMVDWSQAFDRLSYKNGIESFIEKGVCPSLIPLLINIFQNCKMKVKWNGKLSKEHILNGGGPKGV